MLNTLKISYGLQIVSVQDRIRRVRGPIFNIPLLVEDEATSKSVKATGLSFHWRVAFLGFIVYIFLKFQPN